MYSVMTKTGLTSPLPERFTRELITFLDRYTRLFFKAFPLSLFTGPACQQTDHRRDAVQGNHWLRSQDPQGTGLHLLLERQPGQRDPLLPHSSPQLRLQRQVQEDLPRWCGSKNTVLAPLRWQSGIWRCRWCHLPLLRVSSGLRQDQTRCRHRQRRSRERVHRSWKLPHQDLQNRWHQGSLPRVQRVSAGYHHLQSGLLRMLRHS